MSPWIALALAGSAAAAPFLSEFMAANDSWLADEDGAFADWIEICNPDAAPLSLEGYHLTDDPADLRQWTFPEVTLDPGACLVVFASGKNRADPAGELHTNFRLAAEGDYLALVAPDGVTLVTAFAPAYPAQSDNGSFGIARGSSPPEWTFFTTPTPGAPNGNGVRAGPVVQVIEPNPPQPVTGPLTVMARVSPANDPVAEVTLSYRRMFSVDTLLAMRDDGTGGDAAADDGVWTAVIPESAFVPGEMTRWRFTARDTRGTATSEPPFRDPLDSPRYFGTVPEDITVQTKLPVFHWFTTSPGGAGTGTGSRGSVYYAGEFYDNVLFTLHGQSSSGFPKKSYNLDFNRSQRFRWSPDAPRVADIDLLSNWADKSKVRHVLAYEVMRESGVAAHFAFTVRVQQNGAFFSTADLVEDADEIYLERAGLNPDGALYKVYNNVLNRDAGNTGNSGVEKKTRRDEDNRDLQALIDGLDLTGVALERYLFDHIDIPRTVNMLAANSVIRNIDMHAKNWYIYCDTGRSGEWAMLPWDLDLSFGRMWNTQNTYYDNRIYTDGYVVNSTSIRLVSQLFSNPTTRAMLMRRIRTLSDRFLQPPPAPGTPESALYFERRLNEQLALIDPPDLAPSDARRDFEKWGSWRHGGTFVPYTNPSPDVETMAEAVQRWKDEYLPARRQFIYGTQIAERGGELPLPQVGGGPTTDFEPLVGTGARVKVLVPANGNLGLTWTGEPALEPFDDSAWVNGVSGVGYERGAGYESLIGLNVDSLMAANNSIYIRIEFNVDDPAAFDRLELRMKYDDGFAAFLNGVPVAAANAPEPLAWNAAATRSQEANRNAFLTFDVTDQRSAVRAGRNILAIQGLNESVGSSDMIIVPELHGGLVIPPSTQEPRIEFGEIDASPVSGNQDEEYVELRNPHSFAMDVSGWRLTGAIEHTVVGGTVIPADGSLFVSANAAAFRARAVSPTGGEGRFVQGGWQGHLTGLGGTLTLLDATGTTNNVLTYEARPSDLQRALVVSEIMYHPSDDDLAEFIELLNISDTVALNLQGVRFTQGIDFDFTGSAHTLLAPGERVVVVRDLAAFERAHGTGLPVAGVFANDTALSNSGEGLRLEDADHDTIREFSYSDDPPWPDADGSGRSLVLRAPETGPDHALAASWRAGSRDGGSPGVADSGGFQGDPEGDANGNGEPDLIDYVLGNDSGQTPVAVQLVRQPSGAGEPDELMLIHPARLDAQDVVLGVSVSRDLVAWENASSGLELVSQAPLDDGRVKVTWRIHPSLAAESQIFLRLHAALR